MSENCIQINISKWGIIVTILVGLIAIITPVITVATSLNQVKQNTVDIQTLQVEFGNINAQLSAINTNVQLLINGKIKN